MQSFLDSVAEKLLETEKNELKNTLVVFPSRRALVFFKKALAMQMKKSGWAPLLYSMEDFVSSHSPLIQLDQIDLLLQLYRVHQEIEHANFQDFDEFIGWGSILLQDFNELDRHLVDVEELYAFLNEAKAIERWELENNELTAIQDNYLKFWSNLKQYYLIFKTSLLKQKYAYQGLIFRTVAENKEQLKFKNHNIYFAGFNAFTNAEQALIKRYSEFGKTKLYFDSDDFYFKAKYHEAGHFLRQQEQNENAIFINTKGFSLPKKIDIFGVSGNIGQAKLCGELIHESKTKDIALVLSDEQLLLPILDAIPQKVEDINVTMGYPIGLSVAYRFAESIIQLYSEASEQEGKLFFNKLKVNQLLNHPFWGNFDENLKVILDRTLNSIELTYSQKVKLSQLENINDELKCSLFSKLNTTKCIEIILMLLNQKVNFLKSEDKFELTELNEVLKGLRKLKDRLNDNSLHISWKSLSFMFRHVFSQTTVSFVGEAISGLQIMGILESRTLDFDTLILTSVNEGILPSGKSQNSFIPYDIKRKFGLPSYKEKDAIYAYHFYSLLQRAKQIKILYNTQNDGLKGGEKSRFVYQLMEELQAYCPESRIIEHQVNQRPPKLNKISTEIEKTEQTINLSKEFLRKGWSASSLNTFLSCPLNFYYTKILGVKESERREKEVELNIFGSIVHQTLDSLYRPYLNQLITENTLKGIAKEVDPLINLYFKELLSSEFETGIKRIAFEVAKKYVERVINFDLKTIKHNDLIIEELEETKERSLVIESLGFEVKLRGNIDRIDSLNGERRIIDYKTGSVDPKNLKNSNYTNLTKGDKKEFVQLIIYQFLMKNEINKIGLLSLKNRDIEFLHAINTDKNFDSNEEIISQLISDATIRLLNQNDKFRHAESSKYCKFCL